MTTHEYISVQRKITKHIILIRDLKNHTFYSSAWILNVMCAHNFHKYYILFCLLIYLIQAIKITAKAGTEKGHSYINLVDELAIRYIWNVSVAVTLINIFLPIYQVACRKSILAKFGNIIVCTEAFLYPVQYGKSIYTMIPIFKRQHLDGKTLVRWMRRIEQNTEK